ncbi:Bug family tripartite tricarboxylate transporter substrate binding protein [Cupriavidus sp. H19C3]|uniref:Bug family tripartite tricarboxylate transporter substrate binding protein n=1 Tax=Cupriavidus sp. H19C3 TaxID=3241603 RepID=UPI003BF86BA0
MPELPVASEGEKTRRQNVRRFLCGAFLLACCALWQGVAQADEGAATCIAPAKPEGGYDITCRIARKLWQDTAPSGKALKIVYMPGGIGAVAFNAIVAQRPAEANTIVAFSSGSLLNIATGKFSLFGADSVKWLASVGIDHGMIAVRTDSPYQSLNDLAVAMKKEPGKVLFGAGGSIGSQDWMKAALFARKVGVSHTAMRYVAFEGGGEAFAALLSGHVQAVPGDIAEAAGLVASKKIRILAVLSAERLPGKLATIPTAREQGFDIDWPTLRGFYMGPKVSQSDLMRWEASFRQMAASPGYARAIEAYGLTPDSKVGAELDSHVQQEVRRYKELARQFDLVR